VHDLVCFHCQQATEKYLKALLEELGQTMPKTHDLLRLLLLLLPSHPSLRRFRRGAEFLSDFAVDTRYPGGSTSKREATAARRWAERFRQECRTLLGLKPPRRRSN
jgi:HEPN domain-containing protein